MNYSKRKYKSLLIISALIILMGGCNKTAKVSSDVKSANNNKNAETPSGIDNNKNGDSFRIKSGLLIGLSKDNGMKEVSPIERLSNDYRTLWIHQENNGITYIEKKGEIIVPYKDTFYKVGNNKFTMSDPSGSNSEFDSFFSKFNFYYYFSNIVSHPADKPMQNLYTTETFKKKYLNTQEGYGADSFKSQVECLRYVGNNFACVMEYNFETGGGTLRSGSDDFKMYDLGSLSSLNGRNKTIALADLLDESEKAKLQDYYKKYYEVSSEGLLKVEQIADIKNLVLSRKDGKWQVLIPLYRVSEHSGNGSTGRYVIEYINTDIRLPKAITSYDDLCIPWDTIKKKIPEAKDAISSPNNDVLAVLTPTKLLIFSNPLSGIDKPALSIDVDSNESIILNQWSTGEFVDKWNKEINKY